MSVGPGHERDNARFGELIRAARVTQSLRAQDVAERLGVSSAYVRLIEQGRRAPAYETAVALLRLLGVSIDTFDGQPEWIDDAWVDLIITEAEGGDTTCVTFTSRVRARRADDEHYLDWLAKRRETTDIPGEREFLESVIREERAKESPTDALLGTLVRRLGDASEGDLEAVSSLLDRLATKRVPKPPKTTAS